MQNTLSTVGNALTTSGDPNPETLNAESHRLESKIKPRVQTGDRREAIAIQKAKTRKANAPVMKQHVQVPVQVIARSKMKLLLKQRRRVVAVGMETGLASRCALNTFRGFKNSAHHVHAQTLKLEQLLA